MRRVLIVDDSAADRQSLRRLVQKTLPEAKVAEGATLPELYEQLASPCDLLFQDIALQPRGPNVDSTGLWAIYDVVDSFPKLPIVVVTGHVVQKAGEIVRGVLDCRSVVGFLDKAEYGAAHVEEVVAKAKERSREWEEENERADLLDELFAEADRRFEEHKQALAEETRGASEASALARRALTDSDWLERARAEAQLCDGDCHRTVLTLCLEIEKQIHALCRAPSEEAPTFFKRLTWIQDTCGLARDQFWLVNDAWSCRNAIVHARRRATIGDAKKLRDALDALDSLEH